MILNVHSTVAPRFRNKEAVPLVDDSSKYRRERISAAVFLIGFIAYSVFLVVATHLRSAQCSYEVQVWINGYTFWPTHVKQSLQWVFSILRTAFDLNSFWF